VQPIQKKIPMRNTQAASDLYIPDPDIGGLAKSIRSLYAAILTRAIKDIFKPTYSDYEIYKIPSPILDSN
jgi:hypothetical protein